VCVGVAENLLMDLVTADAAHDVRAGDEDAPPILVPSAQNTMTLAPSIRPQTA
jgi:hypothetical protein